MNSINLGTGNLTVAMDPEVQLDQKPTIDHVYSLVNDTSSGASTSASMNSSPTSMYTVRGRSKVWNEFTVTPDRKKVTCHHCGDSLAYSNSHSTSSMLKHLKRKHNLNLYPTMGDDESTSSSADRFAKTNNVGMDKRNRPKPKKPIPKYAEEIDTSVQHGPLLFKDPCVRMKWTDHSDTFLRTFSSLYSDESYTDVTIVVEKLYFKAHRVILSSASEFFDETFKMTPSGQHPIIFLKDVKAMDLRILLDFIYKGEVSIPPSLIPGLVKIGSDLRVRGLSDFVWNEQLANSIFQPQPYQNVQNVTDPNAQLSQMPTMAPAMNQNTLSSPQHQIIPSFTSPSSNSNVIPTSVTTVNKFSPVRTNTIGRSTQQLISSQETITSPQQPVASVTNGVITPTFSRILNIQPTGHCASNLQGQIIEGDIDTVCSVANSFPSMKRIRIVTSKPLLTEKSRCKINSDNTNMQGLGSTDTETDTVLMVTSEEGTVLSTTRGGVTVLSSPSSMALPTTSMRLKDGRFNQMSQISDLQTSQLHSQPVAMLSTAQSQSRAEELDQVVYSITEIPDGGHEVLLTSDSEMVDCCEAGDEIVDKKPF